VNVCFATIASGNYLAYVQVLRDTVAQHAPDAAFRVLLVDRPSPELAVAISRTGLRVTYAHELGLPDFEHLAFKYDVVELNTALKPSFLKHLFAEGFDRAVYLDPDIRMMAPPEPVIQALDRAQIVLTPHSLGPVMDGKRPSDIDYLRQGSYNLGFIGLSAGADSRAFLDWWERRCLGQGFNDATFGVFVDQKWVDLAPSYFDSVCILRHPGCNVAYWNLHERTLARSGNGFTANGVPLVFFHFSGVDPQMPHLLSRHQNRHVPESGSVLAELVANYSADVLAAGHAHYRRMGYGFARLDDGTPITPLMRRAAACLEMDSSNPFSASSPFQRQLRTHGLVEPPPAGTEGSTLNFNSDDGRVRAVNTAVRLLARLAGAERVRQLLRYATFLSWGSNYPAVLLRKPLDVGHRDPR
jgi:hypothetical protein